MLTSASSSWIWFEIVDAESRQRVPDTAVVSFPRTSDIHDINTFRHKIFQSLNRDEAPRCLWSIGVYENKSALTMLPSDATIDAYGHSAATPLAVTLPTSPYEEIPATIVGGKRKRDHLDPASCLFDGKLLARGCGAFPDWNVGEVHKIPTISKCLESLGGCSRNGEIFWRSEDQRVARYIVDTWFQDPPSKDSVKRCILTGSPGVGKSTLICVMAFYLFAVRKKNVVLCRKIAAI